MKKKSTFFYLALFVAILLNYYAEAQTYVLNEPLTSKASFEKFTTVNVKGTQMWYFNESNPNYGAVMSGYDGASHENEDWLISSPMDLSNIENAKLSFEFSRGNLGVLNVGVNQGWYKVFATDYYTGDIAGTVWKEVTGINYILATAWQFVSSGEVAIPASAVSASSRIAFRYMCDDSESATWEVKTVKVFGDVPSTGVNFKITTWNVDWLSCTDLDFNDRDRELQMNNVVSMIKTMNSDFVALQEVGTSNAYATIDILVQKLGSEWAGKIEPSSTDNCSQNQGILYKKSKINFLNAALLKNAGSAYNWSSGRFPALYNVNFVVENSQIPVSFINIHAKALADEGSYARRRDASISLKQFIDGSAYNIQKIVVIGDFNDYLIGTSCTTCGNLSPYKNFMDDTNNYKGLSADLTHPYFSNPAIDNIVISNELFDNYLDNTTQYEYAASQTIPNYRTTTSTHYPVSVIFSFNATQGQGIAELPAASFSVYPNPTNGELIIDNGELRVDNVDVFDIYGKKLSSHHLIPSSSHHLINIAHLPAGIYFLQVDGVVVKVVKY